MKKRFTYFIVIIIALVSIFFLIKNVLLKDNSTSETTDISDLVQSKPLPIPPLLEDLDPNPNQAEFHLTAQQGTSEILDGVESETLGYNENILGPIIRIREGQEVNVKMKNDLNDATTLHWHGLRIDGKYDGGPHSIVRPGETWEPQFTVEQPAATLWYHPHMMGMTAKQVYEGLAGLVYIEDEVSDNLDIPKEHGVNDFPLIIQDKKLDASGNMTYTPTITDKMMGLLGDTFLINGAISPYLEVPKGMVRLRILNGSNARTYHFSFDNKQKFHQIASDGGFLERPVEMSRLRLSPGERAEILVDFSEFETGDNIALINTASDMENFSSDSDNIEEKEVIELMEFIVTDNHSGVDDIPTQLTNIEPTDPKYATVTREFVMAGVGDSLTINDKMMDMDRIDEEVNFNETEIWEVSNLRTGINGGDRKSVV